MLQKHSVLNVARGFALEADRCGIVVFFCVCVFIFIILLSQMTFMENFVTYFLLIRNGLLPRQPWCCLVC